MENQKILSSEEIIASGVLFDEDDIHWGGEFGDQVCKWGDSGEDVPYDGLLYEFLKGRISYYGYFKNGVKDGLFVEFYNNGNIEDFKYFKKGTLHGERIHYHDNGQIALKGNYFYGIALSLSEWDDMGNLVSEQLEPTSDDQRRIIQIEEYIQYKQDLQ